MMGKRIILEDDSFFEEEAEVEEIEIRGDDEITQEAASQGMEINAAGDVMFQYNNKVTELFQRPYRERMSPKRRNWK